MAQSSHQRRLTDLSTDVLAQITGCTGAGILQLWKCGDSLLHLRLKHGGCTSVRLVHERMQSKPPIKYVIPLMLYGLRKLQSLTIIKHHQGATAGIPPLGKLSKTLRYLDLQLVGNYHVAQSTDFAAAFPELTHLRLDFPPPLKGTASLPNYLPTLPPTLLSLRTAGIRIISCEKMVESLPPNLQTFIYDAALPGHRIQWTSAHVAKMPRSLTDFGAGGHLLRIDRVGDFALLPPGLTHLRFTELNSGLFENLSPQQPIFPPTLSSISFTVRFYDLKCLTTVLPLLPADLATLQCEFYDDTFDGDVGVLKWPETPTRLPPGEWLNMLPPNLLHLELGRIPLPIDWEAVETGKTPLWPTSLLTLDLGGLRSSDEVAKLNLPPKLERFRLDTSEFDVGNDVAGGEELVLPPSLTALHQLGCAINYADLPCTLTTLTIPLGSYRSLAKLPDALTHLTLCDAWMLGVFYNDTFSTPLPASLQKLQLSRDSMHGLDNLSSSILRGFPPSLQSLELDGFSIWFENFDALPRGLRELRAKIRCMTLPVRRGEVDKALAALPPKLQDLNLDLEDECYERPITFSQLPETLRRLRVGGSLPVIIDAALPKLEEVAVSISSDEKAVAALYDQHPYLKRAQLDFID